MFGINSGTNMRGLNEFISDIRGCKDKESENKRVETELAKIREKFTTEKGLNAYQRKKYIWKLLYIHILGYEVDFGFSEAASLINSSKYDEKYTGYISLSLLINDKNDEIWKSIVHSIESDLRSRNEGFQSLAFSMIASIVPDLLVGALIDNITKIATTNQSSTAIRKKAIMCLARIMKKHPNQYDMKKFIGSVSEMFEPRNTSLSFQSAAATFLTTLMQYTNPDSLKEVQPKVIRNLHKLAISKDCSMNYLYYQTPNPWLQMKLYKILQVWTPPDEKGMLSLVEEIIAKVLRKTDVSKSINKTNIEYGLLFEVINLVIVYDSKLNKKLLSDVSKILVVFISSSPANVRYLGLQAMCRLAIKHDMSDHQTKILINLDDNDVSIRRRALDLLYLICKSENASVIVAELLGYLENRNDPLIRDDLVLKIAILAQKFAENVIWYVDVVVKLIQNAEVENDIWYRIIQIITGFVNANQQLQTYAAQKLFITLSVPHITETLKCVGAYILSEFSDCLVKQGRDPRKIFEIVYKHFQTANNKSKAMMLNAFAKFGIKYPALKEEIQLIFHQCSEHWDPDVQQRGIEFTTLFSEDEAVQKKVLSQNPPFTEEQQQSNPLLTKFIKGGRKAKDSKQTHQGKIPSMHQIQSEQRQSSHPLANHPCFRKAIDRMCPNAVNLIDIPGKIDLKPYWKEAFIKKTPFDDCEVKEKLNENTLQVILQIHVQTSEMQFKVFRSKGFEITNTPIKYTPDSQHVMLVLTPNGDKIQPPVVGIAWKNTQGAIAKKQVQLPIAISKFLNPVELTYEKFNAFYREYSLPNQKFHKLDSFLKIPDGVKGRDYMKKMGSFFTSVCNFKCNSHPSPENLQVIFGSATFPLKDNSKLTNFPIMLEIEAYELDKGSAVRMSLRGGNGPSLASLYQTAIAFFG